MEFSANLYDGEGKEIELKPGHVLVIGQNAIVQVPVDTYEAKMVYKPPNLRCEFGGGNGFKFPTSDGRLINWEDLNEEIHDGDDRDT